MANTDERLKPAQPLPALRPTTVDDYSEVQLKRSHDGRVATIKWDTAKRMNPLSDEYIADLIKNGGAPYGRPRMPSFRANMSDAPPGVEGAIMRSGRTGQSVACAVIATVQASPSAMSAATARFMLLSRIAFRQRQEGVGADY